MLLILGVVAALAVLVYLVATRSPRPSGLDALGSVSDRWIAELRASSNHTR